MLVILASWLITAVMPESSMHSLLSPEGIRWYFGHFTQNLAQPLLVWIILLYIAYNAFQRGGLQHALSSLVRGERLMLRQRSALWLVLIVVGAMLVILLMLIAVPAPILASVTGELFPSSFSSAFIPIVAFIIFIASITYAIATGLVQKYRQPYQNRFSIWLLVYVLGVQLYQCIRFVFG
jgi:aminobenzoyl-glutamate transport protein